MKLFVTGFILLLVLASTLAEPSSLQENEDDYSEMQDSEALQDFLPADLGHILMNYCNFDSLHRL